MMTRAKQDRLQDVNLEEIGKQIIRRRQLTKFASCMVTYAKKIKNSIFNPQGPFKNWISLVLCVTSISLDPLFFYIPVINRDKYCMNLNKKLGIASCVVRSIIDLFYMIYISFQLQNDTIHYNIPYKSREFYINFLAVLPLPQVVIIIIVSTMRVSKFLDTMNILNYFLLFQFVPRVIRIYPLLKKATSTSGVLTEVTWAKAAFNLYLYLLAGHVFGAMWYFFAIEREVKCWEKACLVQTRCNDQSFYCHKNSGNYSFLEDFCSTKSQNTTIIDFGIYHAALDSGVAEGRFPQKFLYCFRWGLQSLSCFAQNLETSINIWENILTISITISSMVLFVFLIGNMQLYIQTQTIRSEEMKLKVREIGEWKLFENVSKNLQQQVQKYQQYVWEETKGVDVENALNDLPKDLRRSIKRELCETIIKKVPNFESISDQRLNAICERLKHVLYLDETYIVQKKNPIDEMLFIKHGKLLIDESSNGIFNEYQSDFCGGELSMWAQEYCPSTSNLPISTKTVKTKTKVEAFALTADDLKDVFTQFQ